MTLCSFIIGDNQPQSHVRAATPFESSAGEITAHNDRDSLLSKIGANGLINGTVRNRRQCSQAVQLFPVNRNPLPIQRVVSRSYITHAEEKYDTVSCEIRIDAGV